MPDVKVLSDSGSSVLTSATNAREHCTIDHTTNVILGTAVGHQIRLAVAGQPTSLYTIKEVRTGETATIRVGPEGYAKLTGATGVSFMATATTPAPASLSDKEARAAGEFIESLN